jgi:8-oxo-dGTP diphosphatase
MENFRVAAKSFIVDNNKLLILKRRSDDVQKPGIWEIPGGRLELGEDPREGLKREVLEETSLDIDILHPMSVRHFKRDDGQTITLLIFLCKNLNKNIKLSEEHSEYEWIPLENCKDKLTEFFHQEVDIFNKLELSKYL